MAPRIGTYSRTTGETDVTITIGLDGTGQSSISTGNGMLDHLLNQLSRHGLIDLEVTATGDSALTGWHHTVEDTGIALGRALANAVGDGAGIRRMGHALVPLDEALARVALDISGRGYAAIDSGHRRYAGRRPPGRPRAALPAVVRHRGPRHTPHHGPRRRQRAPQSGSVVQSARQSAARRRRTRPPRPSLSAEHEGDDLRVAAQRALARCDNLHLVRLDDRVGEELVAHLPHLAFGGRAVGGV